MRFFRNITLSLFLLYIITSLLIYVPPCRAVEEATQPPQWHSLIIGINTYEDKRIPELDTPIDDGQELAELLRTNYSFKVKTLFNEEASWENIDVELRRLIQEASERDSVLIYYGGHGDLDKELGEGWWYPVDTVVGRRQTYLNNSDLRELITKMKARHVLVVSDSCFSASLFGEYRSMPGKIDDRYHQRLFEGKSRLGLTSGGKEPVMDGGSGGHSIFAYHFLRFLRESDRDVFSVGEMFRDLAPAVTNNSQQKPEFLPILYTGHESGEFIFIRSGTDIVNYVSSVTGKTISKDAIAERGYTNYLFAGVGLLGFLVTLVLLVPYRASRKRKRLVALALGQRNPSLIAELDVQKGLKDEGVLHELSVLQRDCKGLILQGVRSKVLIAPGPRQGLGRGNWVLDITDPHISRKPHCWLQHQASKIIITSDGAELRVNGEIVVTASLAKGDILELGPITEIMVDRCLAGVGLLLTIIKGPEKGKRLVLCGEQFPFGWLSDGNKNFGKLSWRQSKPCLEVEEEDDHPLKEKVELSSLILLDGDVLRFGEEEWIVERL